MVVLGTIKGSSTFSNHATCDQSQSGEAIPLNCHRSPSLSPGRTEGSFSSKDSEGSTWCRAGWRTPPAPLYSWAPRGSSGSRTRTSNSWSLKKGIGFWDDGRSCYLTRVEKIIRVRYLILVNPKHMFHDEMGRPTRYTLVRAATSQHTLNVCRPQYMAYPKVLLPIYALLTILSIPCTKNRTSAHGKKLYIGTGTVQRVFLS